MRMFIIISALMLPFTLNAQTARDNQNARGAHTEGSAPKTRAAVACITRPRRIAKKDAARAAPSAKTLSNVWYGPCNLEGS
jgi:hypothetical protein